MHVQVDNKLQCSVCYFAFIHGLLIINEFTIFLHAYVTVTDSSGKIVPSEVVLQEWAFVHNIKRF